MPVLLLKYWKYLAAILLCVACYAGGYFSHNPAETTTVTEHSSEHDKAQEIEVSKTTDHINKVTRIIKQKDGTEITEITDHSTVVEKQTSKTTIEKTLTEDKKTEIVKPAATDPYRPDYRLGAQVHNQVSATWDPNYSVEAGYRILGNLWTTGSYNIGHKEIGVGLSIDF